jgi:hypothetical protein
VFSTGSSVATIASQPGLTAGVPVRQPLGAGRRERSGATKYVRRPKLYEDCAPSPENGMTFTPPPSSGAFDSNTVFTTNNVTQFGASVTYYDNGQPGLTAIAAPGGFNNVVCSEYSAVGAGSGNSGTSYGGPGFGSFIGAGIGNVASAGYSSFVGGGITNAAMGQGGSGEGGGGYEYDAAQSQEEPQNGNISGGYDSFVGGGDLNQIADGLNDFSGDSGEGDGSFIAAGGYLSAKAGSTTASNAIGGADSFIGAGDSNSVSAQEAVAGAGDGNTTGGQAAFVGAGQSNSASAQWAAVANGDNNTASGTSSFVGSGSNNGASAVSSVIAGGNNNKAGGEGSFIGAGGTVLTSGGNSASGKDSFIGAGDSNAVAANEAAIGSGLLNAITSKGVYGAIAGGQRNTINGEWGAVAGGNANQAGERGFVGGGYGNKATAEYAMVPGGDGNTAAGIASFAAGHLADATQKGSFVWSDESGSAALKDTAANQFIARATGGFYFSTSSKGGAELKAGSGAWASLSDRNAKAAIRPIDDASVLAKVSALPVSSWQYRSERGITHVGPIAQDFYATFGVGEDDRHIASIDEDGVALSAIKALDRKNASLEAGNAALERRVDELAAAVARLRRRH